MNSPQAYNWSITSGIESKEITDALNAGFEVSSETDKAEQLELLDDVDWDIFRSGKLLSRKDKNLYQLHHENKQPTEETAKGHPRFSWDFPEGEFQRELKSLIDLRALMPVGRFELQTKKIVLRNSDEKIVVRASLVSIGDVATETDEENQVKSSACLFIHLAPLRGYEDELKQAMGLLKPYLSQELASTGLKAQLACKGLGPSDEELLSEDFGITPDETVEQAIRQMSLHMLDVARQNEQGVIEDIDTEFLHQYRVNLRKTRSLLNLMKQALPLEVHQPLKTLLAELAGITNDLRDLDVFLLERDYYSKMLPENFSQGLEHLFKMIAADREKARKAVFNSFTSARHHEAYDEVVSILSQAPLFASDLASRPIKKVASKKILKRYYKIGLLGAAITDETPDEEVHELRIECKKLRYLMEFFIELYPRKKMKKLIRSLKKLQNILGNFNDYSVQKGFLADYEKSHRKSAALSAAINGLVAVLHQKQIQERTKVQEAFNHFNKNDVKDSFTGLFDSRSNGVAS